ncbi:MAG: ATP-dependent RecD-like DNA helicase [Firmicutes bacterium]|nr:ATP-dependent RecD-like DNA helicase [Bacillota bacterium]
MQDLLELNGTVEDIIYQNSDNGYSVFSFSCDDDEIICVGTVPDIHNGETLKISGNWTMHPTYGRQLQIQYYEKSIPTTTEGMIKYLSSGLIKGIGPKIAKKIVDKFGEATFYVIEEKPDRLVEIKGITYEKAMKISNTFREQHELRRAMIFLQNFGVSPTYAMKIYKKYRERTFDVVQKNPYRLADDVFGIGFKMADKMAAAAGFSEDSIYRIKAGIKYVLSTSAADGHVYLPKEELMEKTAELLEIDVSLVENGIIELQMEHQVWYEELDGVQIVYLNVYYYAEIYTAKKLLELNEAYADNEKDYTKLIEKNSKGIVLADMQKKAVETALKSGVMVITGGPGTGKTTIINTILDIMDDEKKVTVLAAPTGRAAKRMTEATGRDAQTIHRILGITYINDDARKQTFDKDEDDPIEADIIIIDESSMVDVLLMSSLLKAVKIGTRLIMVGDVDQLPSVGAGNVLKDIIDSGVINVVRLTEVFRQARESAIIMNAHRINSGENPVINEKEKDFFFVKRTNATDAISTLRELMLTRLPSFNGCDPYTDIQVLTPMRKGQLGVEELNKELQKTLNPEGRGKKEKTFRNTVFRVGDKVMQIKNNYNMSWKIYSSGRKIQEEGLGIFNGDCGTIIDINEIDEYVLVLFDDGKWVQYDFIQLDELELSYAVTIHKSQGSEYPVVIIPLISGPPMLLSRNLLYTAVTRAKSLVVMVGIPETMYKMVDNMREIKRYSTLSKRLQNLREFMFG